MKVLFITLSNIGDAVLTTPALSVILENFQDSEITLMVSPRVADLFKGDPYFKKIIIFRKDSSPGKKLALIKTLRAEDFDLLIDFKDTMLPFLLYAKKKTPIFKKAPPYIRHMKDKHMWKLRQVLTDIPDKEYKPKIWISPETEEEVKKILKSNNVSDTESIVAIAPGARSHTKQWNKDGFLDVSRRVVSELKYKVVLVGDQQDCRVCSKIMEDAGPGVIDLCGKTNLKQLAGILKRSSLLITNDSAPMHMAWAVETPVVAVFGPTDPEKYKPTGPRDVVVSKKIECSPCQSALCRRNDDCMNAITADEVFQSAKNVLKA